MTSANVLFCFYNYYINPTVYILTFKSSRIRTINPRPRLTVLVWDVKGPTHCSEGVGDDVPGVMAYHFF